MKKLICFVNFGSEYTEMLHLCLSSLEKNIDETYHIFVITDRYIKRKGIDQIILQGHDGNRHPEQGRMNIHKLIDLSEYDFVYYFDHDIIFHRHLNELKTDTGKVICSKELRCYMNNPCVNLLQSELVGREEELSINNGSVIVPKKYSETFFELWKQHSEWFHFQYNNDYTKFYACQSALNKMYVNKIFEFDFFESNQVHWPADSEKEFQVTEDTVFSHYAGMSLEDRLIQMKNDLDKLTVTNDHRTEV